MRRPRSATVAGIALVGALVATTMSRSAVDRIPVPRDDASPEAVVATFIAAINARDQHTIAAITPPSHADSYTVWFSSTLEDVTIDAARSIDDPAIPGEVVYVHVDFVVRGSDASFPTGELVGWGYALSRESGSGRWLIMASGVG